MTRFDSLTDALEHYFGPSATLGRHEKRGRHEARPAGYIETPNPLTPEQAAELKRLWTEALESGPPIWRAARPVTWGTHQSRPGRVG